MLTSIDNWTLIHTPYIKLGYIEVQSLIKDVWPESVSIKHNAKMLTSIENWTLIYIPCIQLGYIEVQSLINQKGFP